MRDKLLALAEQCGNLLKKHTLLLCTAESCTGGGLSYWMTAVPGSSAWFERGFVTYSNAAKMNMLGVNATTLDKYGAVSSETAREMASGALLNSLADVSIAVTGIAGPEGGSADKPVGTVWIGWSKRGEHTHTQHFKFEGTRAEVRDQTMVKAFQGLLAFIK